MPNPAEAFERRGAEWTFDADGYYQFVTRLRDPIQETVIITAPSFSHSLKDPTPEAIRILPGHRIIVIEGLYVFLGTNRWRDAAGLLDERWFVDVDLEVAATRLVKRHVLTGVTATEDEALWRAQNNDLPSE